MKKISKAFVRITGAVLGVLAVSRGNAYGNFGTAPIEPEAAYPDLYEAVIRVVLMIPMSFVFVAAGLALLSNRITKGYWEKSYDLRILLSSSLAIIFSALTVLPHIAESPALSEDSQVAILLSYALASFLVCARMLVLSLGYIGRRIMGRTKKK